jgi:hypothetical protein
MGTWTSELTLVSEDGCDSYFNAGDVNHRLPGGS